MTILHKKGFSLLELILVLGVGAMISFIKFQDMRTEQEQVLANAVGQQIKQVGEAVNGYINIRYDKIALLSNASGNGTDPGPRNCNTASSICTITYQTLINEGLLPTTYSSKNSFGSDYTIQLKRSGISPNYIVDGMIMTNSAWIEGGHIRYDMLGRAMMSAGVDSGVTKSNTSINGYSNGWNYNNSAFSVISKPGTLGYRVGYNSSMYSVYLRRDGTLPMTGNLNMGGQNIINSNNITAAGTVTSQSLKTTGNTNVGGTLAVTGGTTLSGAVQVKNTLNTTGAITTSSNITGVNINGTNITGTSLTGNTITSRGETYTQNWFRTTGDGGIYFQKYGGGWNMTDANTIRAYGGKNIATTGAITASGNITGNTITSNGGMVSKGRLTANEYVQINGLATAGAACSPNGLQGRDNTGQLLSCTSGKWTAIGSGFFRSPKPQTIQCTAKGSYVNWTYQARMDVSGQVYSRKYSNNGDDSGWMTGPSTFVTMNGVTGTASAQSCASHNQCSYSTPTCSASWNWNP